MSTDLMNLTNAIERLELTAKGLEEWKTSAAENMDQMFLVIMGIIIYLMQGGFALIEAGCVRSKNTTNILIKNLLDSLHYGGGVWGVISVGLLTRDVGILYKWNAEAALTLVWQITSLVAIIAWTGALCFVMFFLLKKFNLLRVSFEWEVKGLDIPKHGEPAYPAEAYGHGWGEKGDTLFTMVEKATNIPSKSVRRGSSLSLGSASMQSNGTNKTNL